MTIPRPSFRVCLSIVLLLATIAFAEEEPVQATPVKMLEAWNAALTPNANLGDHRLADNVSDEFLAEIAGKVSQDNLMAHIVALCSFETRFTFRPEFLQAAAYVYDAMESYGLDVSYDDHEFGGHTLRNVVGRLWGAKYPERIVVIGAHLDNTLFPSEMNSFSRVIGADDNATGVATVLEAARILSQYQPPFSVEFVAFGGEEQLMLGSRYYVGARMDREEHFVAAVAVDSLAYNPDDQMKQKADANRNSEWLLPLVTRAEAFTGVSTVLVTADSQDHELWRMQDHEPFWYHGVPALAIGGTAFGPRWHTLDDNIENMNVPLFVEGAKLSILTEAELAFAEPLQPQVRVYARYEEYEFGARVDADISYINPGPSMEALLYLALVAPDESMYFYPSWGTDFQATEVSLPANTSCKRLRLLSLHLPSYVPLIASPGAYKIASCLAKLDGEPLGQIDYAAFDVGFEDYCPEGMVLVPSGNYTDYFGASHHVCHFCMDRYEYPNAAGQTPLHSVSWLEAWSKCIEQGKYLCSMDEWVRACKGPDNLVFPYGSSYQMGICNTESSAPAPAGSFDRCISGFGIHDMSGNVFEWTSSGQWKNLLFGGFYKSQGLGASCDYGFYNYPVSATGAVDNAGFRCCMR